MKYLSRPYKSLGIAGLVGTVLMGTGLIGSPHAACAQANDLGQLVAGSSPLLLSNSQGYLGVDLADVDAEKAQTLKLKEVRGAIIT